MPDDTKNVICRCVWVPISEMNTTGTKMPQVYVGRFFEPASFSTGFHGKLSSSSANSAHFGKTNKLREKQENLDNSYFCAQKAEGVGYGGKRQQQVRLGKSRKAEKHVWCSHPCLAHV